MRKFFASLLLFVSLFIQNRPGYSDQLIQKRYVEQILVELQREYNTKIKEALPKILTVLSFLYTMKTSIEQRLNEKSCRIPYDECLFLTGQLNFINESILKIETKNIITSSLIKNLYQHIVIMLQMGFYTTSPKRALPRLNS